MHLPIQLTVCICIIKTYSRLLGKVSFMLYLIRAIVFKPHGFSSFVFFDTHNQNKEFMKFVFLRLFRNVLQINVGLNKKSKSNSL